MNPEELRANERTREDLYELVWSKPMETVASELGISGVALAKRCRKLSIPTPTRGYWAKIQAGKRPVRPKLPETIGGELPQVPISSSHTQWPREVGGLCERARSLIAALNDLKPDYEGLQSLRHAQFPRVFVTKAMIEAAARLFHALLFSIEATGVPFRKARSKYDGGYFESDGNRISIEIAEMTKPLPLTPSWQSKKTGTGKLSVTLEAGSYDGRRWKRVWSQERDGGTREIVAAITSAVTDYYAERAKQKAAEAERRRIEHERWVQQQEVEKRQHHEQALVDTRQQRLRDFLHAVEWSHLHNKTLAFLAECEARWKAVGTTLTQQQEEWLQWARGAADAWSPWQTGYPDPLKDGNFDPSAVPFGGPYPSTRNYPRPPTMPKLTVPQPTDPWAVHHAPQKEQYPFWLRQQR